MKFGLTTDKTLSLIQFWKLFFEDQQDLLPNFDWYFNIVFSKGVMFPQARPSPYFQEKQVQPQSHMQPQRSSSLPIDEAPSKRSKSALPGSQRDYLDTSQFNEKKKKLYNDLLVVLDNIDLTNSIMNEKGDREILSTMVSNLNQMESKFDKLKDKLKIVGEKELFKFTEHLLKEIIKTYKRANVYGKSRSNAGFYLAADFLDQACNL